MPKQELIVFVFLYVCVHIGTSQPCFVMMRAGNNDLVFWPLQFLSHQLGNNIFLLSTIILSSFTTFSHPVIRNFVLWYSDNSFSYWVLCLKHSNMLILSGIYRMHLMGDKCRINSKHQNTYFELGRVLSAGPDSEVYGEWGCQAFDMILFFDRHILTCCHSSCFLVNIVNQVVLLVLKSKGQT